jgi:hypothetical protein
MLEPVFALALSGSDLYAGGDFTTAGGVGALRIAKWDGSSWSALSSGINGGVTALAVSGSDLYVGGGFTTAGEIGLNYIAKWNGSGWDALSSGLNGAVYALAVSGSDLYAGGVFTTAGGMPATNIAKWDGSNWTALGSGIEGDPAAVYTLAVSGSDLYAGGVFTMAGGVAATNVAKWDGSNWTALGSGIGPDYAAVYALAVSGNDLLAGGYFWTAGGRAADLIAKWDGSSWSAVGSGLGADRTGPFYVSALAVSGGDLYAGGQFRNQGGVSAANVAKWNGSNWSALGSGIDGGRYGPNWIELPAVNVLTVFGSDLYAGGGFTMAGGVAATNIAKWDGTNWSALGSGMNHGVSALAVSGNELYAGGSFTTAGGKVSAYLAKAIIYPPVLTLQHSASGTNLIRFSGVPGTAYHLQRAPTLAGPWPSIATNTAPANGRIEVGDGAPLGGQGFYRVFEP